MSQVAAEDAGGEAALLPAEKTPLRIPSFFQSSSSTLPHCRQPGKRETVRASGRC